MEWESSDKGGSHSYFMAVSVINLPGYFINPYEIMRTLPVLLCSYINKYQQYQTV